MLSPTRRVCRAMDYIVVEGGSATGRILGWLEECRASIGTSHVSPDVAPTMTNSNPVT